MADPEVTSEKVNKVIIDMCADPGRQFSKDAHAERLNSIIQKTKIPKIVADLFIDVTMMSTPFTGAHSKDSFLALQKLVKEKGNIVDNLLHCVAKMKDSEQNLTVIDFNKGPSTKTTKVSFKKQRALAKGELEKRGKPAYNADYYLK